MEKFRYGGRHGGVGKDDRVVPFPAIESDSNNVTYRDGEVVEFELGRFSVMDFIYNVIRGGYCISRPVIFPKEQGHRLIRQLEETKGDSVIVLKVIARVQEVPEKN